MTTHIELQYSAGDGHTWLLRVRRDRLHDAVDAVFSWFATIDEFSSQHLGVFLAAILCDAIEQNLLSIDSYSVVRRIMHEVPKADIDYTAKVNLMRSIVLAALDSTA
jgi:hypothetical protein